MNVARLESLNRHFHISQISHNVSNSAESHIENSVCCHIQEYIMVQDRSTFIS